MAIQPIDAQVLFSRMNQMGKEQAEQKDQQTHAQLVTGSQIAKRSEEDSRRVTATPDAEGENIRQIKDEKRRQARRGAKAPEEEEKTDDGEAGNKQAESVQETYLGRKIDITG